ncbi:hypothetical protein MHUMG1_05930 [Metarhizium humberi]|uniref:Uncharacterized protein n=1 Tax=Metarhizium humberi TaxID=2596975 RepID=A0A9P8S5X9_9HYPO|nr:hypothetical protein MHUMG1_05930 [Metarhizium humberi]
MSLPARPSPKDEACLLRKDQGGRAGTPLSFPTQVLKQDIIKRKDLSNLVTSSMCLATTLISLAPETMSGTLHNAPPLSLVKLLVIMFTTRVEEASAWHLELVVLSTAQLGIHVAAASAHSTCHGSDRVYRWPGSKVREPKTARGEGDCNWIPLYCLVPQPFVTSLVQGPNPADRSHQLWSLSRDE